MADKATLIAEIGSALEDGGMNTALELRTVLADIVNSNVNIDENSLQAMIGELTFPNQRFISTGYRSLVDQVPAVDLTAQNIVYEITDQAVPELTMNVDGSFIFNTECQVEGALTLTIGRAAAGPQESIWLWSETLVSTGPDVWAPAPGSVTRATTNAAIDTTIFPFALDSVSPGDTYRIRMEAEDASELVGLYTEPATGNHPAVPSAVIALRIREG